MSIKKPLMMLMRVREKVGKGEFKNAIDIIEVKPLKCDMENIVYAKGLAYDYPTGLLINTTPIRNVAALTEHVNSLKDKIEKAREGLYKKNENLINRKENIMDFKLVSKDLTKSIALRELIKIKSRINLEWEGAQDVLAVIDEAIEKLEEI